MGGHRQRHSILGIVVASLFVALLTRMWYLQVLNAGEFQLAALRNAVELVEEPAPRGRVLDRNGAVLIDNRPSNVVTIDRSVLDGDEVVAVFERLAPIVGVPKETLTARMADERVSRYAPVAIARDLPDETVIMLRERQDDFPGVDASPVSTPLRPAPAPSRPQEMTVDADRAHMTYATTLAGAIEGHQWWPMRQRRSRT